ncbi:LysM peptidoglycan-binding domain-containing protein [Mycoplasmatota bacterium zrk1]
MIFHIVKQSDTIKDLIFKYGVDKSEIISSNQHISNWDTLIPGVKLKIPIINERLIEHLDEVEPFIEDYYSKQEDDITYGVDEQVEFNNEDNESSVEEVGNENSSESISSEEVTVKDEKKEVNVEEFTKNIKYPKYNYYRMSNPHYRNIYYDPRSGRYFYF